MGATPVGGGGGTGGAEIAGCTGGAIATGGAAIAGCKGGAIATGGAVIAGWNTGDAACGTRGGILTGGSPARRTCGPSPFQSFQVSVAMGGFDGLPWKR